LSAFRAKRLRKPHFPTFELASEVNIIGDMKLFRIGELAKNAGVSERTIDYYTKLGLIAPEERTQKNYRLYSHETLTRLERIVQMKQEKYSLEEIKQSLEKWRLVSTEEQVASKLTTLELHVQQLEREVNELKPLLGEMKPVQARKMMAGLLTKSAGTMEALKILLENTMM
jgi:DNA-binding transcriptional MerR regulator